ncbi:hypothetical protein Ddc_16405 [Ditylenchus destructor]|nr:hypothetical protein Ddc_16405 [Ditylenchus destructor]
MASTLNFLMVLALIFVISTNFEVQADGRCQHGDAAVGVGVGKGCPFDIPACDKYCRSLGVGYTSGGCTCMAKLSWRAGEEADGSWRSHPLVWLVALTLTFGAT